MPKTTFFLRNNNDNHFTKTLYCRLTINKTKCEFSLKEKLNANEWNQSFQKCVSKCSEKKKYINSLIETSSFKIKNLALISNVDTAKELIALIDKKNRPEPTLKEIIQFYIDNACEDLKEITIKHHTAKLNNLTQFEKAENKTFTAKNFDAITGQGFIDWYKKEKSTRNSNTAIRNVLFFRSCIEFSINKGKTEHNLLINFKANKDKPKETIFLTTEEIAMLEKKEFDSKILSRIKDLFLFQCYTGLSYGDLFKQFELVKKASGTYIQGKRCKNSNEFLTPISLKNLAILQKYDFKLPRYENQVYNRVLKEIALFCGITKKISTHTGRKTFANLMDSDLWSRESISKMLGHRNTKTTEQYYIGNSTKRIEVEMLQRNSA